MNSQELFSEDNYHALGAMTKTNMAESSLDANDENNTDGTYSRTEKMIIDFLTCNQYQAWTCREIALQTRLEINAVSGRVNGLKDMAKKPRKGGAVIKVFEKRLCTTAKGSKKVRVQCVQLINWSEI